MKICLLTVGLAVSVLTQAHASDSIHLTAAPVTRDSTVTAIPSMNDMTGEIVHLLGLQQNFELREANVLNIEACVKRRKRLIRYNPEYIAWVNQVTGDKWASMALIAHEIGHHLNGHTLRRSGSRPALELEADEFAGYVLGQLGATLEQSQRVMKFIARKRTSKTHPARDLRMAAIRAGWQKAKGINKSESLATAR